MKQIGVNQKPFFYWSLIDDVIETPLTTLVHSNGASAPLSKIWLPKLLRKDAHTLAHPMGMANKEKENVFLV